MAIVVKSDFWGGSYAFIRPVGGLRKRIARLLDQRGMRKDRQLVNILLGAAAGSTATATNKRVAHSTSELGGLRTIETETLVNRATTAADDTDLTTNLLTYASRPTYPTDRARSW